MVQDFQKQRRFRVPVPLKRSEYKAVELYAARLGLPLSRVLLAIAEKSIKQIVEGKDPLDDGTK